MSLFGLVLSTVYVTAGFSACVAFMVLKNYPSAVLALCTGIVSVVTTHLHCLKRKNRLREWYEPVNLRQMSRFGFYFFTFGAMSLAYFTAIEVMLRIPMLPVAGSAIISIVWAGLTLKAGLMLCLYARAYSTEEDEELLATAEEEEGEERDPEAAREEEVAAVETFVPTTGAT